MSALLTFVFSFVFFVVVAFSMEAIVANDAGPAADAAFRDAYMGQLEAFMAEARVLTAERISLGNSVTASGSARQQSPRGWATSKATWMPSAFASTARITFARSTRRRGCEHRTTRAQCD